MRRHNAADAKESSVAKRSENARQEKKQKGRRQGAQRIADEKHAHQNQESAFTIHARQG